MPYQTISVFELALPGHDAIYFTWKLYGSFVKIKKNQISNLEIWTTRLKKEINAI